MLFPDLDAAWEVRDGWKCQRATGGQPETTLLIANFDRPPAYYAKNPVTLTVTVGWKSGTRRRCFAFP